MKFHLAEIKEINGKNVNYNINRSECNQHHDIRSYSTKPIIDSPSEFHKYYKKYPKETCIHCLNAASKLWPKAFN